MNTFVLVITETKCTTKDCTDTDLQISKLVPAVRWGCGRRLWNSLSWTKCVGSDRGWSGNYHGNQDRRGTNRATRRQNSWHAWFSKCYIFKKIDYIRLRTKFCPTHLLDRQFHSPLAILQSDMWSPRLCDRSDIIHNKNSHLLLM